VIRAVPALLLTSTRTGLLRSVLREMREFGASRVLVERANELPLDDGRATPRCAPTVAHDARR
jgi:hypothetical protein